MKTKNKLPKCRTRLAFMAAALIIGFFVSMWLRVIIAGHEGARSVPGALVFSVCLVALAYSAGFKWNLNLRAVNIGLIGGIFLCVPALILHLIGDSSFQGSGNYWIWAVVVLFVVIAMEIFLRGALYDVLSKKFNPTTAIIVGALLFAILHVPLYGWNVVPLDFAVGLWLGSLRLVSGSVVSPIIAHYIADLVGWWA